MTNKILRCKVRKSGEGYEGTVFVPGLRPAKLVKKDDTYIYTNKSGVTSAAKSFAERHGYTLEMEDATVAVKKNKAETIS